MVREVNAVSRLLQRSREKLSRARTEDAQPATCTNLFQAGQALNADRSRDRALVKPDQRQQAQPRRRHLTGENAQRFEARTREIVGEDQRVRSVIRVLA